jgi:hypothetical protein
MTLYVAVYATSDDNYTQIRTAVPWSLYQEDILLYTEAQARALAKQTPPGAGYEFQALEILPNWWPGCEGRAACGYLHLDWFPEAEAEPPVWLSTCEERAVAFYDNPTDGESNALIYACMWHAPYMADSLAVCRRHERIQES